MPSLQIIILTLAMIALGSNGPDVDKITIVPEGESLIWIEGSTNVSGFSCEAKRFSSVGIMENDYTNEQLSNGVKRDELTIEAEIPVNSLDCGKRRMNRDLYKALKGDDHPHISFEFIEAVAVDDSSEYMFMVRGDLTVAGITRTISFGANGHYQSNNLWRAIGDTNIFMKDFEIDPPSPVMGLVRVDDRLSVNFNLVVELNNELLKAGLHE